MAVGGQKWMAASGQAGFRWPPTEVDPVAYRTVGEPGSARRWTIRLHNLLAIPG